MARPPRDTPERQFLLIAVLLVLLLVVLGWVFLGLLQYVTGGVLP